MGEINEDELKKLAYEIDELGGNPLSKLEGILKLLPSNIYIKDKEGRYLFATQYWHHLNMEDNDGHWSIAGKTDLEVRKDKENALIAMESDKRVVESDKGTSYVININLDNKQEYFKVIKEPIHDDKGNVVGIVGLIYDVTEEENIRISLEKESLFDSLTGLKNRRAFDLYVEELANGDILPVSFIVADCNYLKETNDTFGHLVGDELLRMAAVVLRDVIPDEFQLFRTGGDEFVSILPGIDQNQANKYVEEIIKLENSFRIRNNPLSLAIGISCFDNKDIDIKEVINEADMAMYSDKEKIKRNVCKIKKEGRLINPEFNTFLEALGKTVDTVSAVSEGLKGIGSFIRLGKLTVTLYQPVSKYTPMGEMMEKTVYLTDEEVSPESDYVREIHMEEGGMVVFKGYVIKGEDSFTHSERSDLNAIIDIIMLHGARNRLVSKLKMTSLTNYLTGLPNSGGFINEIGNKLNNGDIIRFDSYFINLRGFGIINRKYGRTEGDNCVKRYADKVTKELVKGEVLSHFGGDNFAALIYKDRRREFLDFISSLQISAYRGPFEEKVRVYSTVGLYPIDEFEQPEEIMTACSAALSVARAQRKDVVIINPEMHKQIILNKMLMQEFADALKNGAIEVYYQPKVDIRTNEIIGAEALARWNRDNNVLLPAKFISILEKNGHSLELDLYMLKKVCADIKAWQDLGNDTVPVSVNFSRRDICDEERTPKDTANMILSTIEQAGIDPGKIMIEVTETVDETEQKQLFEFMTELCLGGINTSIDDFGTGYSSLSILRDFPISEIKIDRSFINYERLGRNDEIIIQSIMTMAKKLGIDVITEGVETEAQVEFLRKLGCYKVQGFLFDKPLTKYEWERRLTRGGY